MLTTALIAENPTKEKVVKNDLAVEIVKMFGDSKIDMPQEEINTTVTFTLNKKNKIVVIDVDCDCEGVISFVEGKLDNKTLAVNNVKRGSIYTLPIKLVRAW